MAISLPCVPRPIRTTNGNRKISETGVSPNFSVAFPKGAFFARRRRPQHGQQG
jgi:hypothetical protein